MDIELSFNELMQRYDEPECQMLIQALATLSVQEQFEDMTPDEIFYFIKRQADEVACIEREDER